MKQPLQAIARALTAPVRSLYSHPRRAAAIALSVVITWGAVQTYTATISGVSEPTGRITVDSSLLASGLSVVVGGSGVEKINETEYRAQVGSQVAIAAVNERARFSRWDAVGANVTAAGNAYTTIAAMPANDVTLRAVVQPATEGTTLETAYILDEFDDFFALQEIIANAVVPADGATTFARYLARFGLSGAYATARSKLQYGHFKVPATVALTEPKPAGAPDDWMPTRFFTGIGQSNAATTSFQGVIDGGGHLIVMNINNENADASVNQYTGLFGAVTAYTAGTVNGGPKPPVVLRNIKVAGAVLSTVTFRDAALSSYVGGIAGLLNTNVMMTGCESKVYMFGNAAYPKPATNRCLYLGGLAGYTTAPISHGSGNRYSAHQVSLSGESNSAVYVGGCFGMSNSVYVRDARAELDGCHVTATSTNNTVAMSGAHVGGIVGSFGGNEKLENCYVTSPRNMTINATTDGANASFSACAGGIAGLVGGTAELSNNNVDADSDRNDTVDVVSMATIRCRDLSASTVSTVYAGGLYGRFSSNTVKLAAPFGSVRADDPNAMFNGHVQPSTLLSGKSSSYTGGLVGYGFFNMSGGASPAFNLTGLHVRTAQKNTTTKYAPLGVDDPNTGTSYTGGMSGSLHNSVALGGVTLYGDNVTVEAYRETGTVGNISPIYVGGLTGYKNGGSLTDCKVLFINSKIELVQDSYLSTSGNVYLGGLVGMTDMACLMADCLLAGSRAPDGSYSGTTTSIQCVINTMGQSHGVADGYVGGLVGKANNSAHMVRCRYQGCGISDKGLIKLVSNHACNSPSIGGIAGFASASKTTDCHVSRAHILGDGYNNNPMYTDTDIIVGGLVGLVTGLGSIENGSVSDSRIEANGRDYTLTYAGGILGSQYASASAVIRGCVSQGNEIVTKAQKKWAAGGGIAGYHYDATMVIDNCLSIDNTIFSEGENVEEGQYTEAIGGGIVGRVNHSGALTTKITNCWSNAKMVLTHVEDSKICFGGIIGFRTDLSRLTFSGNGFHVQHLGADAAVGYCPPSPALTALNSASVVDFSRRVLDNAHPKMALFSAGIKPGRLDIVDGGAGEGAVQPHEVTFLSGSEVVDGVSCANQYLIGKKSGVTDTGFSVCHASISQFVPGSPYPAGTEQARVSGVFGTVPVTVIDGEIPPVTAVALHEDSREGPIVSPERGNDVVALPVDLRPDGAEYRYEAVSEPEIETPHGPQSLTSFRFFAVSDGAYEPIQAAALTRCGVTLTVDQNHVKIRANIAIDAPRSFAIQAVDVQTQTVVSDRVTITLMPTFVQEVRLERYRSPENMGSGTVKDMTNRPGSAQSPLLIVNRSTLKLDAQVYGEGSLNIWTPEEIYVAPTSAGAQFEAAEHVSGLAGALRVHADGTCFTNTSPGDNLDGAVYRTRIRSVGKNRDGDNVYSDYIYIKLIDPPTVYKMTTGSLDKNMMVIAPEDQDADVKYRIGGGNIDGGNIMLLPWDIDYVFSTNPQASFGGEPEVYYVFGSPGPDNPFRKIEIGEINNTAYGLPTGDASQANYEFCIKANPAQNKPLTITVKYFKSTAVGFYPQDGRDPFFISLPIRRSMGKNLMAQFNNQHRSGYTFEGWYPVGNQAASDAAYGAILTERTLIDGGNVFFGRWKYKLTVRDNGGLRFEGALPVNETKDFTFDIVKRQHFLGAPPCDIAIGPADNPLPIPAAYDQETEQQYHETIDGVDTLCAKLTVTGRPSGDTVYHYWFSADYLNRHVGGGTAEQADGIVIAAGETDAAIIAAENKTAATDATALQDTIFTIRYIANHAAGVDGQPPTYGYRAENRDRPKVLDVRLKKKDNTPQTLPAGTTIRLHYQVLDPTENLMKQSVWKTVLPTDSDSFQTSDFRLMGETAPFPGMTFAQFTVRGDFVPEEYCFVVTVPFKSRAIDVQSGLTAEIGFAENGVPAPDAWQAVAMDVRPNREVHLTLNDTAEKVLGRSGGVFGIEALFTDDTEAVWKEVDNRSRHYGIDISFTDARGRAVSLAPGSRVQVQSPPRTITTHMASPRAHHYFVLQPGPVSINVTAVPHLAPSFERIQSPALTQSPGAYSMHISLLASDWDNLYANGSVVASYTVPILVT